MKIKRCLINIISCYFFRKKYKKACGNHIPNLFANIDEPAAGQTVADNFSVKGWFFASNGEILVKNLLVNDEVARKIHVSQKRPDVLSAFHSLDIDELCGFSEEINYNLLDVPANQLKISLELQDSYGNTLQAGPVRVRVDKKLGPQPAHYDYHNYQLAERCVNAKTVLDRCGIDNTSDGIPLSNQPEYFHWLQREYPSQSHIRQQERQQKKFSFRPLMSIIMPVYNTDENMLEAAITSVRHQAYDNWQLCIADDGSTKSSIKELIAGYHQKDRRIKVVFLPRNKHIPAASNAALEQATGQFVCFFDHDDILAPHALYEVVKLLNEHPDADFIYTDEDKIDPYNRLCDPFFKPEWSPDTLLSKMYTLHFACYRRTLVMLAGGLREHCNGAQDYDLALRITEHTDAIYHIPQILYHWRIHPQSMASGPHNPKAHYAYKAAKIAVEEALLRRNEKAVVETEKELPGVHTIHFTLLKKDCVSVVLAVDSPDGVESCVKTLLCANETYPCCEINIIAEKTIAPAVELAVRQGQTHSPHPIRIYPVEQKSRPGMFNFGVLKSCGKYVLFLESMVEFRSKNGIEALAAQAQRARVACVAPLMLTPDRKIYHAGIAFGINGGAANIYYNTPCKDNPGNFSHLMSVNNFAAVSADCLLCRRRLFNEAGRFDESLTHYYDLDLCLRLMEKNYYHLCLPYVQSCIKKSDRVDRRGNYVIAPSQRSQWNEFYHRWHKIVTNDPYYNPHLNRSAADYAIG